MAARRALLPACARALDCRLSPPLRCGCASLASGGAPARTALPPSRRANFRLCAAGIAEAEAAELTSSKGRPTFLFRAASLNTASETASTLTDDDDEKLELLDPDFYRMGYVRDVRAYGVEFKEGPKGVGVYFTNDIPSVKVPLTVLEIPVEIMVTVSKEPPWIFRPDFLPLGDPLFPVINSTNAEADWDIRLACMLLLGLHQEGNFWHFYGDFLPPLEECPSLLLATQAELAELEEPQLEQYMAGQQRRLEAFWAQHWASADVPFNLAQLCQSKEQFKWAVAQVWSRSQLVHCIFSSLRQDTHLLCPYADMLNHSYDPNCAFRWRKHDQMLEVYIMAGQSIRKGDELTFAYVEQQPNSALMRDFGFSLPHNEWEGVVFSGKFKIHRDSFLSTFNISGMFDNYYLRDNDEQQTDGLGRWIIAAARTLPMWHDGDMPPLPSEEIAAVAGIRRECEALLAEYSTTVEEDRRLLEAGSRGKSERWKVIMKYRIHRKEFLQTIMEALHVYSESFWN